MAIVKVIDNPVDSQDSLFNLCHYIAGDAGSIKRHFCYGRGVNPNNAFEEIKYMQELFGKTANRRAYHITVDFSDEEYLTISDAVTIGYELSDLFFPEYQVLFSVHGEHTGQEHLHLHFAVNTVSLFGRNKLHIDFDKLKFIRECVDLVIKNCI